MTDPIADMLTRIRNAQAVNKEDVVIPFSKTKIAIAQILEEEGFLDKVERFKEANKFGNEFENIKVRLRYSKEDGTPIIRSIKRISKPGCKIYSKYENLPHVLGGLGIAIVSTSQGLMTNRQARKKKVGGEVICEVF